MFESLESYESDVESIEDKKISLSALESEYINECIEAENPEALVDRIDEISGYQPPKGIDSKSEIADILAPVKDTIESKYLEAPADLEQIGQLGDYLASVEELRYEKWSELSIEEKYRALQVAEIKIAEIEHRDFCTVEIKNLDPCSYGYYNSATKTITLNEMYIKDNDSISFKQTLDTLIHEGRHAYQDYNMTEREVHPREGEVNMWKWNENDIGYQDANFCGFEAYAMQPVETDARAFAEDVLKSYFEKIA